MFVLDPNMEMMIPKMFNHVLKVVIAVLEPNKLNVPAVKLDVFYMITNVSNDTLSIIMEVIKNTNHATISLPNMR